MEITVAKDVNVRLLSWEIFQALGINLGGWNNLTGVPQTGSLAWSQTGGLELTCADSSLGVVARIESLVLAHDAAAPLPGDFPADPVAVLPPDPAIAVAAAAADVVAEIDKAFTARATPLTAAEKGTMRDKVVALIAKAQGR